MLTSMSLWHVQNVCEWYVGGASVAFVAQLVPCTRQKHVNSQKVTYAMWLLAAVLHTSPATKGSHPRNVGGASRNMCGKTSCIASGSCNALC